MPTKFAILGDGAWGTAISILLAKDPDHSATLWSARPENGRLLRERREKGRLWPGVPIPAAVQLTTDFVEAVSGAELWIAAVPTVYLRATLTPLAGKVRAERPVLSLAKGLENATFLRPTEILHQ